MQGRRGSPCCRYPMPMNQMSTESRALYIFEVRGDLVTLEPLAGDRSWTERRRVRFSNRLPVGTHAFAYQNLLTRSVARK